jgi:hypothetical protein
MAKQKEGAREREREGGEGFIIRERRGKVLGKLS